MAAGPAEEEAAEDEAAAWDMVGRWGQRACGWGVGLWWCMGT